jgi:Cu/Ag efflux protein CusF
MTLRRAGIVARPHAHRLEKVTMKKLSLIVAAALFGLGDAASAALAGDDDARPRMVAQAAPQNIFHGRGKVTSVAAASGLITIAHEDIPGLMDAMEMQFEAKAPKMLEGLKAGDKVAFAIEGKTYRLLEISRAANGN